MTALCQNAFIDTENIDRWSFTFPGPTSPLRDELVIDSLEFTTSQDDVTAVGTCATQTGLWACEASTSLLPQRAVCTGEPTNGTCPGGDVAYEGVAVPGPLQSPPSVTIDIPASVPCDSSSVTLAATVSDPDADLDHVRWYVDDVPIASTTTSIPFSTNHEVRAVAHDLRGAATTATKQIGCN